MQPKPSSLGVALVTGGAKGIGLAISTSLAAAGWDLVLCGRDLPALDALATELSAKHAVRIEPLAADLSRPDAVSGLFAEMGRKGVFPTALVSNAGNYGELGNIAEVDFQAWKKSFDLNFFSTVELVQTFIREAKKRAPAVRKKIVILSGSGLGGSTVAPGISAYACAKGAIYRFVEVVHEEESGHGIDINCIAPGVVKTGIIDQAMQAGREKLGALYDLSAKVMKEGGTPPELTGEMTVRLLSPICDGLSGRLMSARWDGKFIESVDSVKKVAADRDLLRLRRIDNDLFGATAKK